MSHRRRGYEENEAYHSVGREVRYERNDQEIDQYGSSSRTRYATSPYALSGGYDGYATQHAVAETTELPNVGSKSYSKEWATFIAARPNRGIDLAQRFNHSDSDMERIDRMLNAMDPPSHMGDGIYVSNLKTARAYIRNEHLPSFRYPQIKYVISIIEFKQKDSDKTWMSIKPSEKFPSDRLLQLDVPDSTKVKLGEYFPMICKWIHDRVERRKDKEDGGILIHCLKGISRSVTVAMAYRIWRHWETPAQALETVRASRPVAWPNSEFFRQLILWHGTGCKFVDKNGRPDQRYLEYFYDHGREWKPIDQDNPKRPDPKKDMAGLERPKDPYAREPEPLQADPPRRGGWFGRR